jgi:segregation and condensation protein B
LAKNKRSTVHPQPGKSDLENSENISAVEESVTALAQAAAEFADLLSADGHRHSSPQDDEETEITEPDFELDEDDDQSGEDRATEDDIVSGDEDTVIEDPSERSGEDDDLIAGAVSDELAAYETGDVDDSEIKLESYQVLSIIESLLFASDKPVSFDLIKQAFKGTQLKTPDIKRAIEEYRAELAHGQRGVMLDDIGGGYQIRTKTENVDFLRRSVKNRVFKLSGPALEVMAIVAYQQPIIKSQIDEIRGVDSGHLLRALMDRGLVRFAGKSEFPGRPMLYESSRKFLEIFGLRNLRELPSPSEIDDLIPEGIGEPEVQNRNLGALTASLSVDSGTNYSQGEDELLKISEELSAIDTTTEFFEQEKLRQKLERDSQRAQDIRETMLVGQHVESRDLKWLERFEKERQVAAVAGSLDPAVVIEESQTVSESESDVTAGLELSEEQTGRFEPEAEP